MYLCIFSDGHPGEKLLVSLNNVFKLLFYPYSYTVLFFSWYELEFFSCKYYGQILDNLKIVIEKIVVISEIFRKL